LAEEAEASGGAFNVSNCAAVYRKYEASLEKKRRKKREGEGKFGRGEKWCDKGRGRVRQTYCERS
jgi:hypothetical protein